MSDPADGSSGGADRVVGPWRRRSRREVYRNAWLTLYHDEVRRPDGSDGIYGVVHFEHLAVGVVAIDDQDRIVLVGQHRYTVDRASWEIPEGGARRDEDPLVGAQRELREETGVVARRWRELGRTHTSNSVTDEVAVLYLATDLTHGAPEPEPSEGDLACRWVPFADALEMCRDGRITDAMSIIGIGWAAAGQHVGTGGPGREGDPHREVP